MSRTARAGKTEPLVSVLMVNRNHEDTLAEAITSVLSQTHQNLRLIIVDDGSTDGSVAVAEAFLADPRVELHALPKNVHICAATNIGLELVSGEWLARIDSDDVWYPNRLERQLEVLAQHPGQEICFAWADWIDESGNDIRDQVAALAQSCDAAFATQREWLRKFYYEGNCLPHSSVLIRTSLVREVGGFDLAYRQLHDFDYWVRVAKTRNILVVPERLIAMRHFTEAQNEGRNSSDQSLDNVTRTFNEYADIRAHFFEGMPDDVLVDAFGEDFRRADSRTPEELACERAFLLCRPQDEWDVPAAPAGLRALRGLLAQEATRRLLEERYDFPAKSLYELTSSHVYNDPLLRATAALEKDALYSTIDSLEREIDSLRAHVHVLEAVLGQKDAALGQRDAALGEKDAQVQELLGRIGDMEASSSWRVTGPLRSLGRALHGQGGAAEGANAEKNGGLAAPSPAGAGKTVYVHAFLAANLGDDLFVRMLCARYPDVRFLTCAPQDYVARFADVTNLEVRPVSEFSELVRGADAVAHIGGCCFVQHADDFSDFLAADTFLAENARKLVFLGGNFGPYRDPAYLEAYRELFRRYYGLTFRDRYSAELFAGYPNVAYAPDIVFGYPVRASEKRPRAVVAPISFAGRRGNNAIEQYGGAYHDLMVRMVSSLVGRGHEVVLASFCQGQGDEDEIARILGGLAPGMRGAVRTAFYHASPEEVVPKFEEADCVVATRFHAMVLGFAHGCRVLPVVYDQKTQKVLEDLEYPLSLKLEELASADADELVGRLLATEPLDAAPLARASEGHFRFLDQLLRG